MADGVWVKVHPDDAGVPGAAVISGHNGATVETKTIDGTTYDIYTFTDDTATDFSLTVDEPGMVDALIVGGGGGSGNDAGAGAGGLFYQQVMLIAGEQNVTVGSGGAGGSSGLQGTYSRLGSFAVPGGGVGQNGRSEDSVGGSGGGGGRAQPSVTDGVWQYGYPLYGGAYGNSGSGGTSSPITGGGGGGAGGPGVTPEGGPGLPINITGVTVEYARGGSGLSSSDYGVEVADNTGWGANGSAKSGGSGIVIVRVKV